MKCMSEMKKQDCEPNMFTYNALIHGFFNNGDTKSAQKVFDEMTCKRDIITYNTMIHGFCKTSDFDSARQVLGCMRENKDCLPDTVTYTTLIDGYYKKGELEEAMKCMSETEKQGSEPNQISYSILIHCLGKKGDVKNAQKMFNEMICEPNVITYNTMIHGFFKMGDFDSARRVLVRMTESRDCLPDRITCTILIDGYCKKGKSEEAMKCMYEMEKHGCEPDVITYSTMIHGFCRKGDFDSAWRVLGHMRESKDCLPDSVTYTTLIDGYCKKGKLEKAMKCMSEMEKLGCEPNLFSYNALIHGLCLSGQIGEVKEMVTKMRLHCVKDDIVTHMTILKGLCIEGGPDTATKHLKDIVSLGMKPEVAYVVIINEYRKLRKPDGAISLLKEINMRGLELSVSCFNRLLRVLVESGEPERAIFPLKEMHQMGCSPNFFSYNTVICSLCDMRGRMGEVEELVRDMLGNGHELRTNLHGCINKGYCEDGNVNMAVQTFCGTLDNNNIFSLERFSILIKELCAKGMVVESERIFDYMSKKCTVVDVDSYRRVVDEHLCLSGRRKEALDSEAN